MIKTVDNKQVFYRTDEPPSIMVRKYIRIQITSMSSKEWLDIE